MITQDTKCFCGVDQWTIDQNKHRRIVRENHVAFYTQSRLKNSNLDTDLSLVTLHGMMESADCWSSVVGKLSEVCNSAFTLSLPWHAEGEPRWNHHAPAETWLNDMLVQLPSGNKAVLAHSFGANVILESLSQNSNSDICAIVLVAPFYKNNYEELDWNLLKTYVDDFDSFVRSSICVRSGYESLTPERITTVVEKIKQQYGLYNWLAFLEIFSITPALNVSQIDVPVLIIGGEKDQAVSIEDLSKLAIDLPNARLEILNNVGHFSIIENPAFVAHAIQSFLLEHKGINYEQYRSRSP